MRARRVRVVLYGILHRLLFILFAVKGKMYTHTFNWRADAAAGLKNKTILQQASKAVTLLLLQL